MVLDALLLCGLKSFITNKPVFIEHGATGHTSNFILLHLLCRLQSCIHLPFVDEDTILREGKGLPGAWVPRTTPELLLDSISLEEKER